MTATHATRDAAPAPTGSPTAADRARIDAVVWMRKRHHRTVDQGRVDRFRRRRVPTSAMPRLVRACGQYPNMAWVPEELMVPASLPPEGRLATGYKLAYYGLGKLGWALYNRWPIDPELEWDPAFEWNRAFPDKGDGWEHPTSDDTFTRLRLQGPDPFLLRRNDDRSAGTEPTFELDFTDRFAGILPPIVARFEVRGGALAPTDISVGSHTHRPGDPTWDQAKRVVNAADARFAAFGRHLLDTHLIVGSAFALATFALPTWHRLRPFMAFFTYGTLEVNDLAYRALVSPGSYFIESGFATVEDCDHLFANGVDQFDLDQWIVPRDISARGIDAVPDHPYVEDSMLVWPAFVEVVQGHLDDLRLDDAAIAADADLLSWHRALAELLPDADPDQPLDRSRLEDLCTALLWNNVVHEVCGDLGPILGADDPADKAIINLAELRAAVGDGELTDPVAPASMADAFLVDQAQYVSGFNVGGNNILAVNAAALIDDPKLVLAVEDLQATLRELEAELIERNAARPVQFNRMLPRNWEASISF